VRLLYVKGAFVGAIIYGVAYRVSDDGKVHVPRDVGVRLLRNDALEFPDNAPIMFDHEEESGPP